MVSPGSGAWRTSSRAGGRRWRERKGLPGPPGTTDAQFQGISPGRYDLRNLYTGEISVGPSHWGVGVSFTAILSNTGNSNPNLRKAYSRSSCRRGPGGGLRRGRGGVGGGHGACEGGCDGGGDEARREQERVLEVGGGARRSCQAPGRRTAGAQGRWRAVSRFPPSRWRAGRKAAHAPLAPGWPGRRSARGPGGGISRKAS